MNDYVLGFMFDQDMKTVLLIKKNRPDFLAGKLNGIGGKVESDETPPNAMCREFLEESGIVCDSWNFLRTFYTDSYIHVFWAKGDPNSCVFGITDEELWVVEVDRVLSEEAIATINDQGLLPTDTVAPLISACIAANEIMMKS